MRLGWVCPGKGMDQVRTRLGDLGGRTNLPPHPAWGCLPIHPFTLQISPLCDGGIVIIRETLFFQK